MGNSRKAVPLHDMYEKMKAKQKNLIRQRSYFSYLLVSLCNIFAWNVDDSFDTMWSEKYNHISGSFCCKKIGDKFYIAEAPSRAGDIDQYGDGMQVDGVTRNGISLTGTIGEDIAICYNNVDRMPDLDMVRYADGFSQVDKSIMANVRWSILAPVLCTRDDRTTKAIEKLVDDMLEGKLKCITSEDVLDALSGGRGDGVYSVDITHPERIRNVQYQSELYDVLMRRFFNKYGLNIQNSAKHAQVSTDEVHGMDAVSWVMVLDMLHQRQKFCDECNRLWGTSWSVDFAEPWKSEYERFMIRQEQADEEDEKSLEKGAEDDDKSVDDSGNGSSAGESSD